ncbi:MAG: hypothetical protein ACLQGP_15170 [Isosphaeraceae bacterium]
MTDDGHYAIRGGVEGRRRLKVLSRVLRPSTDALFDRLGVCDGMTCLDVGCGGGDVTLELAGREILRERIDVDRFRHRLAGDDQAGHKADGEHRG